MSVCLWIYTRLTCVIIPYIVRNPIVCVFSVCVCSCLFVNIYCLLSKFNIFSLFDIFSCELFVCCFTFILWRYLSFLICCIFRLFRSFLRNFISTNLKWNFLECLENLFYFISKVFLLPFFSPFIHYTAVDCEEREEVKQEVVAIFFSKILFFVCVFWTSCNNSVITVN